VRYPYPLRNTLIRHRFNVGSDIPLDRRIHRAFGSHSFVCSACIYVVFRSDYFMASSIVAVVAW
jgi:hypothetical protein